MDEPIYTYQPARNPGGEATPDAIPGVPLRDLSASDLAALPPWLRASVAVCPFYQLVDAAALAALDAPPEEA